MFKDSPAFSGFSINNKAAALAFYGEKLGCAIKDTGMGLELSFPNGLAVFIYEKEDHESATFTVLNLPVDDISTAVDELVAKGVVMERYDDMPGAQDDRGVMRGKDANMGPNIAWFKDPSGNILSVIEN